MLSQESVLLRCAILLVAVVLLLNHINEDSPPTDRLEAQPTVGGNHNQEPPCDLYYLVGEGETFYSIAEKCGDPFIAERNPHIHDPDDVFPGVVIMLNPYNN